MIECSVTEYRQSSCSPSVLRLVEILKPNTAYCMCGCAPNIDAINKEVLVCSTIHGTFEIPDCTPVHS